MTIIEALKSGKPFRRKSDNCLNYYGYCESDSFSVVDIIGDDWEVKEEEAELKPCPFCGEMPIKRIEIKPEKHWTIFCDNEDCPVEIKTVKFHFTLIEAIAAWNRRG